MSKISMTPPLKERAGFSLEIAALPRFCATARAKCRPSLHFSPRVRPAGPLLLSGRCHRGKAGFDGDSVTNVLDAGNTARSEHGGGFLPLGCNLSRKANHAIHYRNLNSLDRAV